MAIAVWPVEPDGPATWLGSLKLHPVAIPLSGLAVGPNGAVRHCWLAGGSASSREGNTPSWANPPSRRDPAVLESGGWDAVKRPVRLANMEAISVLNDEKPTYKAAILNLPRNQLWGSMEPLGIPSQRFVCPP